MENDLWICTLRSVNIIIQENNDKNELNIRINFL